MNLRLISPQLIVDIGDLTELRGIAVKGDILSIGALTRHVDLQRSADVRRPRALLVEAHRPCCPPRDPQQGNHRRQPCACRSGLRTAGLHDCAGCDHCHRGSKGERRIPAAASSREFMRRTCPRRNCSWRSNCRRRTNCAYFFHEYARRHGDYAIAGLAAQAITADGCF